MKYLLTLVIFFSANGVDCQTLDWFLQYEALYNFEVSGMAEDSNGNVVTHGKLGDNYPVADSIDLDPGMGEFSLSVAPNTEATYTQKLSSDGEVIWTRIFGVNVNIREICTDASGNVYVAGSFEESADLDPTDAIQNFQAQNGNDAFIVKLNFDGELEWIYTIQGDNSEVVYAITYDPVANNILSAGGYQPNDPSVDFDPGPGEVTRTSDNRFFLRLDLNGNFISVESTTGDFGILDLEVSPDGAFIYSGQFSNSDFDVTENEAVLVSDGIFGDGYVARIEADGSFGWVNQIGLIPTTEWADHELSRGMAIDPNGDILYLHEISYATSFTNDGIYYYKYNGLTGETIWSRYIDTCCNPQKGNIWGRDIASDSEGNVYVMGLFNRATDFDPGFGVFTMDSNLNFYLDIFVTKLDSNGNFLWARSFEATDTSTPRKLLISEDDQIYIAGAFTDMMDFDPRSNVELWQTANAERTDGFIIKLFQCVTSSSTETQSACSSFEWPVNGATYSTSGLYSATLTTNQGCDSIVSLELTILETTSGTDHHTACGSFTWIDGNTYTQSTSSATATLINAAGCDSLVTLNLTINEPSSGTDVQVSCEAFTWMDGITYTESTSNPSMTFTNAVGCDSIVTLDLTINESTFGTDVQEACDEFTWIDGVTYTVSNSTASTTLSNAAGCDSIVTLNLSINSAFSTLTISEPSITADQQNVDYQWVDCNDNFTEIPGENNQTFTAVENGIYAVVTTDGNCESTSDCIEITSIGIEEPIENPVQVFPNPFKEYVNITGENVLGNISVYNTYGQLVFQVTTSNYNFAIPSDSWAKGLYVISIENLNYLLLKQ